MRWGLALTTASAVGYFAFLHISFFYPPETLGFYYETRDGRIFVSNVFPGTRAAAAGFQVGDRLDRGHDLSISDEWSWRVVLDNLPVREPITWQLWRDGQSIVTATAPRTRSLAYRGVFETMSAGLISAAFAVSLTLGIILLWRRSDDPTTRIAGWFLVAVGCGTPPEFPRSFAASWRELPLPFGLFLWPAYVTGLTTHLLLFVLFSRMRRPQMSWRSALIVLFPGGVLVSYVVVWTLTKVYAPSYATLPRPFLTAAAISFPVYFLAALAVGGYGLWRRDDLTERRRLRTVLIGTVSGTLGLMGTATSLISSVPAPVRGLALAAGSLLFAVLPSSFAYAMFRHRLFGFRAIIRRGLQYALARGALLAVVPAAIGLLSADIARHSGESVQHIVQTRGWVYLSVAVAALVGHLLRSRLLAVLDRRFFRERYRAQQVLRRIVGNLASARRLDAVAHDVLEEIRSALHPRTAYVLLRQPTAPAFESSASLHGMTHCPPLSGNGALSAAARQAEKPFAVGRDAHALRATLSAEETEWLSVADVDLLIPIKTREGAREVLLALGPRRSEEPYSAEDTDLLATIGDSLGIVERADADTVTRTAAAGAAPEFSRRYQVARLIGHGGMGTVWEAHDDVLDRAVAIKYVKGSNGSDQVRRFEREAQTAAQLVHPNIVVVHDYGLDETGQPFLVMERLVGQTLRERLRREGRLTRDVTMSVVCGAAGGIGAAHAVQLVHRDLKPENIFLCAGDGGCTVKVLDFGLARSLESEDPAMTLTPRGGTLRYMAPEQLDGKRPTPLWDLWALAVITYEMLTGAHPIAASNESVFVQMLLAGRTEPLRTHLPDAPAEWEAFFDCALALEPTRRPRTIADFERQLVHAITR